MKDFLTDLNDQQLMAVKNTEGPSLIIAGAGSGKTRVLTTRIAYLISQGIDPFNILALTFTNKAAREMRSRIEEMVGPNARNLWMGTFHSVFARILRSEASRLGYPSNFTIYDTDDSKSVIKMLLKELQLDSKIYKPSFVYNRISSLKNNLILPVEYTSNPDYMAEDLASGIKFFGEIYLKYTLKCFKSGAMDFDDLLIKTYELLSKYLDVLNKYQHFFKYVLIDEFQDTNLVQYMIVRKIASVSRNLSVVGDDSQSIYSFRGANIKNILNFEKDYPELKVFKLEQNYRSTKTIVEASDNVIKNNKFRLPKKLWTDNSAGHKIKLIRTTSESEEGNRIAQIILNEKKDNAFCNKDFVILYRTNAQSRAFEESLRRFGIEYRLLGSLSFYQRREIKDLLAYYRFVLNPADEEALKRIINIPHRGIGDTTFAKIVVLADDNQCSIWDIILNIKSFDLPARIISLLESFGDLINSFRIVNENNDAFDTADYIARNSGIISMLKEDKSIEGIGRLENVQTLISAVKEFSDREQNTDKSLGAFLQEVSLLTDEDTQKEEGDRVTLMTVHSAKGLEFPVVFVSGLEENLFPSAMSMMSCEDIEEERRLFYVAITRAKTKLFLTFASTRLKWGNFNYCEPSRFLDEIDSDHIDFETEKSAHKYNQFQSQPVLPKSNKPVNLVRKKALIPESFVAEDTSGLSSGMQVEHANFGQGQVIKVEGEGSSKKAVISFNDFGEKQILLKFAKMKIIR